MKLIFFFFVVVVFSTSFSLLLAILFSEKYKTSAFWYTWYILMLASYAFPQVCWSSSSSFFLNSIQERQSQINHVLDPITLLHCSLYFWRQTDQVLSHLFFLVKPRVQLSEWLSWLGCYRCKSNRVGECNKPSSHSHIHIGVGEQAHDQYGEMEQLRSATCLLQSVNYVQISTFHNSWKA